MIASISCKIEELQTRDKKREIALEAANSILDKELTRVSSFVEEKVKYIFFHNYLLHFFLLLYASDKLTSSNLASNLPFFYLLFLIFLHAVLIFLHSKFLILMGQFSVVLMIHNEQAGLKPK